MLWPDELPGNFATRPRRGRRTAVRIAKHLDRALTRFIGRSYPLSLWSKPSDPEAGLTVAVLPSGGRGFGGYVIGRAGDGFGG